MVMKTEKSPGLQSASWRADGESSSPNPNPNPNPRAGALMSQLQEGQAERTNSPLLCLLLPRLLMDLVLGARTGVGINLLYSVYQSKC